MRLLRLEVRNFKLLEDVCLEFSVDPNRPLTIVRAENGSGKTSLLSAMLWAFYGRGGLPAYASDLRLASTAAPAGKPVDVSVMVDFKHDAGGGEGDYRLIRSVAETPDEGDGIKSTAERVQLYHLTSAGEKPVDPPEAFVAQMIPANLRKVFFTNGDDVQDFMSGKVNIRERQEQVHNAIRSLLGLDQLYVARTDLTRVQDRMRRDAAEGGSADFKNAAAAVDSAQSGVDTLKATIEAIEGRLARMRDARAGWNSELSKLKDVGDIDDINTEIERSNADLKDLDRRENEHLTDMRGALKSESLSWDIAGPRLQEGLTILSDLADRGVIPGTAVEVLIDRLEIRECICGTALVEGSEARTHIEHLVEQQRTVSERDQRLTEALHVARTALQAHEARAADGDSFMARRVRALETSTTITDTIRQKRAQLKHAEGRRAQIDEERVRDLVAKIADVDPKIAKDDRALAREGRDAEIAEERLAQAIADYVKIERKANLSAAKKARLDAATDLVHLVKEMISTLEGDHVRRVEKRMAAMFLDIVGSDPEFEASVFADVTIDDSFDIEVRDTGGRKLDFDGEINGASQRALTLSFIWALMEVAGVEAPRTIDTPLGMVSGSVKTRMVDSITTPTPDGAPLQVLLLLTRSEIRDAEEELGRRAGMTRTMTCSRDTSDLVHSWGKDRPIVRMCTCGIDTTCRICARVNDDLRGLSFRDEEAEAR